MRVGSANSPSGIVAVDPQRYMKRVAGLAIVEGRAEAQRVLACGISLQGGFPGCGRHADAQIMNGGQIHALQQVFDHM